MPVKSFMVLVAVLMVAALIYIELASMPGQTALKNKHPQTRAINLLGWIGLALGVLPWLVALVWANMQPLLPISENAGQADGDNNDSDHKAKPKAKHKMEKKHHHKKDDEADRQADDA